MRPPLRRVVRGSELTLAIIVLASCGGGGSSGTPHTVSGTISGLSGRGLVLLDNGGDALPVAANAASFTFATAVADGSPFNVTVSTQPTNPSQTCTVQHGSGMVEGTDVTNVAVSCTTNSYTVGGTVTGLTGSGLVLSNNGGNNLNVSGAGPYTFGAPLPSGQGYGVTVATQPTNPPQTCVVSNGSGTVTTSNVTNANVNCTTNTYSVWAYVSGLTGSGLTLAYNGGAAQAVARNGPSRLASGLEIGTAYSVAITGQPAGQTCVLSNSSGAVGEVDVTTIDVFCPQPAGRRAYVVDGGSVPLGGPVTPGSISLYSIDSGSGALKSIPGSTVPTGPDVAAFQLVPHSSFAWALNVVNGGSVYVYSVDRNTGLLTPDAGNPFQNLAGTGNSGVCPVHINGLGSTFAVAIHPGGTFGYASNFDVMPDFNDGVWQFTIDAMTGEPNLVPNGYVTSVCDGPGPVTIDPSGRFAYVIATVPTNPAGGQPAGVGGLFAFTIDAMTGALTDIPGSPFPFAQPGISLGGLGGYYTRISVDPAGRFAYVVDDSASLMWAFKINPDSGALSGVPGSPFAAAAAVSSMAIEPRGQFAYVTEMSGQSSTVAVFSIDPVSGALSPTPGIAALSLPGVTPLQVDPSGRFAYLTAAVGTTATGVYAYAINASGALTLVIGAPFATTTCSQTGGCPGLVAVTN